MSSRLIVRDLSDTNAAMPYADAPLSAEPFAVTFPPCLATTFSDSGESNALPVWRRSRSTWSRSAPELCAAAPG